MTADVVYLLAGVSLLLAVVLPVALSQHAASPPIVLLVAGALIGLLPIPPGFSVSPIEHRVFVEHLTEFCVVVALMGVGLALDRPLSGGDGPRGGGGGPPGGCSASPCHCASPASPSSAGG